MRALQIKKFGNPGELLKLEEIEKPVPKSSEVLIKMKYCPINPSDLLYIMGQYGVLPELPAIPGFEGMGEVESVGDGINDISIGTRAIVLIAFFIFFLFLIFFI